MARLSGAELRKVIKLIEEGKPLPDEYKFKLFDDGREVELIWNGKTNEVESAVLPFQTIEQVDEPRVEGKQELQLGFDFDSRGRQAGGWTNKLIWGENKFILSSLKNGPLRQEIEDNGGIKLIYIDPPFDVGADFSMDIEIGGETLTKEPNVLEEIAYRDTWGKGADSFISMIYERLNIMRDLLTDNGSIFVHCDWRLNSYIRLVLDEVFGKGNFRNEIVWQRDAVGKGAKKISSQWSKEIESLIWYSKSDNWQFRQLFKDADKLTHTQLKEFRYQEPDGRKFKIVTLGDYSKTSIEEMRKNNLIHTTSTGKEYKKYYLDEFQLAIGSLWNDIPNISHGSNPEAIGYPTQKPLKLLQRVIESSTLKGDIVADFFVGSGTTLVAAEMLNRKWIGSDLGKFSIHTARKRMINIQSQLKSEGKNWRAFEILNLGKYQRQHYIGVNTNLSEDEQAILFAQKDREFVGLILAAYKAETVEGFETFYGQKAGRMIAVGPVNMQMSRDFVDMVIDEAVEKSISRVDVLAFEYEMGLAPQAQEDAKEKGVDLALKIIPPDVFDKRAIEKGQAKFYDVAYIEVKPHHEKQSVAIELIDFSVFYNQDIDESELKSGQTKIVIRDGQVIKLSKDKNTDIVSQGILTKNWTDWVDYWSVDFNYESRKEIIHEFKPDAVQQRLDGEVDPSQISLDNIIEKWTGNYIFENEWQDFRTKKKRELDLKTPFHEYAQPGRYKIAIKVVDIFGNDTTKVVEVSVSGS